LQGDNGVYGSRKCVFSSPSVWFLQDSLNGTKERDTVDPAFFYMRQTVHEPPRMDRKWVKPPGQVERGIQNPFKACERGRNGQQEKGHRNSVREICVVLLSSVTPQGASQGASQGHLRSRCTPSLATEKREERAKCAHCIQASEQSMYVTCFWHECALL